MVTASYRGARAHGFAVGRQLTDHAQLLNGSPRRGAPKKLPGGYVVRDANGQALAYIYSRANETDALQAKVLTEDEARRIAANIAKLPALLTREE